MRVDNESKSRNPRKCSAQCTRPTPQSPRRSRDEQQRCHCAYGEKHRLIPFINGDIRLRPHRTCGDTEGLPPGEAIRQRYPFRNNRDEPSRHVNQPRGPDQKLLSSHLDALCKAGLKKGSPRFSSVVKCGWRNPQPELVSVRNQPNVLDLLGTFRPTARYKGWRLSSHPAFLHRRDAIQSLSQCSSGRAGRSLIECICRVELPSGS